MLVRVFCILMVILCCFILTVIFLLILYYIYIFILYGYDQHSCLHKEYRRQRQMGIRYRHGRRRECGVRGAGPRGPDRLDPYSRFDRHTGCLLHISEHTRRYAISYAVFCLKKKKKYNKRIDKRRYSI